MPRWLAFLLVGGAAMAAWQAEEIWRHSRAPDVEPVNIGDSAAMPDASVYGSPKEPGQGGAASVSGEAAGSKADSPVIYRRDGE